MQRPPPTVWLPRRFALVGGFAIAAAAALIAFVQMELTGRQIRATAERFNESLTDSLSILIADKIDALIASGNSPDAEVVTPDGLADELDRLFARMRHQSGILKVKLYDLNGITIYSTNRKDIGDSRYTNPSYVRALQGHTASDHSFRPTFNAIGGPTTDRYVLSSYLPLHSDAERSRLIGVFEIYTDVTDAVTAMHRTIAVGVFIVVVLMGATYALSLFVVTRGARQIERSHRDNIQLAEAVAHAESATEAKSRFLMTMSHELRTPLNAIIGFSEIMKSESFGPIDVPRYREYVKDIHVSGKHLLRVINDILVLTQVEQGKLTLMIEDVVAADVIEVVQRMLMPSADQKGLTITTDIEPGLGTLRTDEGRLRQILVNLVRNAVKFTPSGGRIEIGVRAVDNGAVVELTVSDTGIGIKPENIALCLEPFGRVNDGLSGSQEGIGLGLHLSKRFAELLEGTLVITSEFGHGTTVAIRLPRHKAERVDAA
jgi:signal transduction histidine kinase